MEVQAKSTTVNLLSMWNLWIDIIREVQLFTLMNCMVQWPFQLFPTYM